MAMGPDRSDRYNPYYGRNPAVKAYNRAQDDAIAAAKAEKARYEGFVRKNINGRLREDGDMELDGGLYSRHLMESLTGIPCKFGNLYVPNDDP